MPEQLPSTEAFLAQSQKIYAAIEAFHAATNARLAARDAASQQPEAPPKPQPQLFFDPATKFLIDPITGTSQPAGPCYLPPGLSECPHAWQVAIVPELPLESDPSPPDETSTPVPTATTSPMPDPGSAPSIVAEVKQHALPVLPADFDLKSADDYEVACFLWLQLSPTEKFTLSTFQQHCRAVFSIGFCKAKRLHHYLEDCGSLEVSLEPRPGVRPIRWYRRAASPPTRVPDEEDDIDTDGIE